jgi:hypothetical protein
MHGLRKNAAVELAEARVSVEGLMAVLGHKTPKMALHYCKLAKNDDAVVKWDAEVERKAKAGRRRALVKAVA